jgi:hypothetical protein
MEFLLGGFARKSRDFGAYRSAVQECSVLFLARFEIDP